MEATPIAAEKAEQAQPKPTIDLKQIVSAPMFVPALLCTLGIGLIFWQFISGLPNLWLGEDGYYSHGFLVPVIAGYVIFKAWPHLKSLPVKPSYFAIIPLVGVLWIAKGAIVTDIEALISLCFIGTLLFSTAFVAGWRWMFATTLPTLYLGFGLPLWTMAIGVYTNPLQLISTKVAYKMLQLMGFQPWRDPSSTTINLPNFNLDVGVPCSGLKLVLALSAFTVFFMLIARLKWWGNAIMAAMVLPLCIFINSLRITLIGIVGENYGSAAGHQFHDYSGYITLILCFFILFKIARWLGWKD